MKIIHCADLHLDSKLGANLGKEEAKNRRDEILHTFERMVDYAANHEVEAILIAGDMFDTKNISAKTRNTVSSQIKKHPEITFYYLRGNHDQDNFLSNLEEVPENLKLFGTSWTTYEIGNVAISGIELTEDNNITAYTTLALDCEKMNIVMMHGQEAESSAKDKAEVVNLRELRNKCIDYLALGHIHMPKREQLDARGIYAYAGCLEGRGFDECGEHGFVLLEVQEDGKGWKDTFVPFAQRTLHEVIVDVTGCDTTAQMIDCIQNVVTEQDIHTQDMVKIRLTGAVDVACEKDPEYIVTSFSHEFYFVKVYDETTLKINVEEYLLDESLKGEFVRIVMQDETLSDADKKVMIRYGLQAIAGEEVQ